MNKAHRHELKMLHYKRRILNLRLKDIDGNFYNYRSHGLPCSCYACSPYKYKRTKIKIEL